jgi:hypothetical protein
MATIFSTPTTVTISNPVNIDKIVDWQARIAGGTTILAQNFNFASTAQLQAAASGISPPVSNVVLTSEHGLSGKSCRINVLKGDGSSHGAWISYLNGRDATIYQRFYFQLTLWQDQWLNWPYQSSDGISTPKFIIIDRQDGSSNTGEVVGICPKMRGMIAAYRLTTGGSFAGFEQTRSTPANGANPAWQPAVDRGTPTNPTTQAQYERRYGPFNYGMTPSNIQSGVPLDQQGVPDPDAAAGGVAFARGTWTVVEFFIDYPNDRVMIWAAKYGDAPLKICDSNVTDERSAKIFPRDIPGYRGFHLLPYRTNGQPESNRPDTFVDYCEVLVKTTPVNFPGGFTPPGNLG